MPYTDEKTILPDQPYKLTILPDNIVFSTVLTGSKRSVYERSRTGENSVSKLANVSKVKRPKVYERRLVTVYRGPKTKVRYFDKKYRRFRYAREPLQVWRNVRVWSPSVKRKSNKKGLNLAPNRLAFFENKVYSKLDSVSVMGEHITYPGNFRQYEGDMIHAPQFGPGAVGVDPHDPAWFSSYPAGSFNPANIAGIVSEADDLAVARLQDKATEKSANIAQFLAERKQTMSMIAETAVRAATALRDLKRGNVRSAFKELFPTNSKKLANDVLAFNFGVKPLLSDIDGMAKYLAEGPENGIIDIIGKSKKPIFYEDTSGWSTGCPCQSVLTITGFVEVTYKIRVKVAMPKIRELTKLGFGNPLALAWELVPWSFVVDWFLPIGDALQRLDSFEGFSFVHGHKTVYIKQYTNLVRNYGGTYASYMFEDKTFARSFEQTSCNRVILNSFPAVRLPSLKDPVSNSHLVNAAALLRQLKR